jgi:hypothetical protein
MGLAQINHEFPSPAGRFLLLTTKVINLTLLSKDYPIFFLDAANLEINQIHPFPFKLSVFALKKINAILMCYSWKLMSSRSENI